MPAVSDAVWEADDTTPGAVEAALRALLRERHAEADEYAPARALNLIVVVDHEWSGEIANRLRKVGRFHASRTIVLSLDERRDGLGARATIASDVHPKPGEFALLRETVVLDVGGPQADDLFTIADPLVVSDLPTVLWSPHGHGESVDMLLPLAQVVLLDSSDDATREAFDRALAIGERAYAVDLAWLRTTPWRERIAASFDPHGLRRQLAQLSQVEVRHAPDSEAAALLLLGWLATRLGWEPSELQQGRGTMHARKQDVKVQLRADPQMQTRGLAGITVETAQGRHLSLDRGRGGLQAHYRNRHGDERQWTVLGASRGEAGILGEGIRQALLRDPTYLPALRAARAMVG